MQAGNPRRVLSWGRGLSWERALLFFWSTSGALWGPDPTAAPIARPLSLIGWLSCSTRKHTPKKSPSNLGTPCRNQPPCPQARKVRERPPAPQEAAATEKGKAPKPPQKKSSICALSVETASQKSQPSFSTEAAILVFPCEMSLETRDLSFLRGTLDSPKNHVERGRQPCREVKDERGEVFFTSVMRNPLQLLVGITYKAVEKNC